MGGQNLGYKARGRLGPVFVLKDAMLPYMTDRFGIPHSRCEGRGE